MSTVILYKGDLYGDRKVLVESMPLHYYDRAKINLSSCEQFGFSLQDPGVDADNPGPQELALRKILEVLTVKVPQVSTSLDTIDGVSDDDVKLVGGNWVANTATMSFLCRGHRVRELRNSTGGVGSDVYAVVGMLHAGKTVKQAYTHAARVSIVTGDSFDVIEQDSLKPFIIGVRDGTGDLAQG